MHFSSNNMDSHGDNPYTHPQVTQNNNDPADDHTEDDPNNTPTGSELLVNAVDGLETFEDEAVENVSARSSMISTTTISSSIWDFPLENGRTYHSLNKGKYLIPNDEDEQQRLDLQHHIFNFSFGELHLAPIKKPPQKVLDIGTGTGIWAIQFGDTYPSAAIIGIDLSPIQPQWVPPNVEFIVDDAEEEWKYRQKFDYIHGRMLFTCFVQPKQVIQSAFDNLEMGGYLELQDAVLPFQSDDGSLDGTDLERWTNSVLEGAKRLGKDWTCASNYKMYMIEAGFSHVQEVARRWPINTWPRDAKEKELGKWFQEDLLEGIEGFSMKTLTESRMMTREEVDVLLMGVRFDINNRNIHAYMNVISVYGCKPSREE